ncbi:MAG: alpha-E domain-containing protein [Leptospiraceae bacterium]|nr:alpha-E domain-containing protein [Leptospiraceae bacterium]MCB1304458.1 alpha-E domain-containing protein [Leptospiraceae bacterium]
MLSRVAESVFWMNRYIERADNYCRFMDVNFQLSLDLPEMANQWGPMVTTTGDNELFEKRFGTYSRENVVQFMTFDTENPSSILSCIRRARENARTIRENISTELWQTLNELYLEMKNRPSSTDLESLERFYTRVRRTCLLFYGILDATVSHDEVHRFALLGRYLERADKTTRILDMKYFILLPSVQDVGTTLDLIQWLSLLKSASAHEMYNRLYQKITPRTIAEFLILNRDFPRALIYCISELDRNLRSVSGASGSSFSNEAEKRTGQLLSELNFTDIEEIFNIGMHEYLDSIQGRLNAIGGAISDRYFAI